MKNLKISTWRNKTTDKGIPYVITEVGVTLFFGGKVQRFYEITHCHNERPFSNQIDLFNLEKETGICPIAFDTVNN